MSAGPRWCGRPPDRGQGQHQDADKVTGGDQFVAESGNGSLAAGDTLGFVATDDSGSTRGQYQAVWASDTNNRERPTLAYQAR